MASSAGEIDVLAGAGEVAAIKANRPKFPARGSQASGLLAWYLAVSANGRADVLPASQHVAWHGEAGGGLRAIVLTHGNHNYVSCA